MAERRLGSSGGVKWCFCCILMSIQIVFSFPHMRSTDTGVPQTTPRRALFGIPFGNTSRGVHAMNEGQTETAWNKRGVKLLRSEEKPVDHTFIKERAEHDNNSRTGAQLQSSPKTAVLRESSKDARPQMQATLSNKSEIYPTASEVDNQAMHSTRNAHMTSNEPNQNLGSGENETTVPRLTESTNQSSTVAENTLSSEVDTSKTSSMLENATFASVTDKKNNKALNSFTTIKKIVQRAHSEEQQEVSQNSSDETTPLNKDKENAVKSVDHTAYSPQKRTDFTTKQPENGEGTNLNKALEELPPFRTTARSHFDTRPAMGSPLSAFKHRSTSLPLMNRQRSTSSSSKTRKAPLTPKISSIFKSSSFITKTVMEKWIKGNNLGIENTSKMSPPVPSGRFKALTFKPSKIDAVSTQAVRVADAAVTSPIMLNYPEALVKDQQRTANDINGNQPSFKTTLMHEFRHTEHTATKRKSTVKVRRSTRDPEEDDSTLPSSRKRSNEAAKLETRTHGPASQSSKPSLLTTKKRHVPHQETSDYGCHSIEWSSGSKLKVSLTGNGEALKVMWEVKPGNSTPSERSPRQVRDTVSEAAQTHNEELHRADSSSTAKVNFKNEAIDIESSIQLINGFVVSYRIQGDEEYDSSRLQANETQFVLPQLHSDKDYTICVHAMSGQHRVHEECAQWSKSLWIRKAVMGGLAGALFFLPCVVVIIIIIRKDKLMQAKHGSGSGTWHLKNPSLVRAFASCEESQEALVQERHAQSNRYTHAGKPYLREDKATNSIKKSDTEQCCHPHLQKPAQRTHMAHQHSQGAYKSELAKDSAGARSSATRHSTKNLILADGAADRELPLLNDILEDNTYCNPTASNTNSVPCKSGLTSMSLAAHEVYNGAQIGCDTETNI